MLAVLCASLGLAACAPRATDVDDVHVTRQAALPRTPVALGGSTNARLGTSLSACRYDGLAIAQPFVAGAPGAKAARLFTPALFSFSPPDAGSEFGVGVLCNGTGNQPEIIAWSAAPHAWRHTFQGATDVLVLPGRVDSMARGDVNASSPVLIGVDAGLYSVAASNPAFLIRNDVDGNVRMACAHGTNICAIAHRGNGAVIVDATTGQLLDTIDPPDAGRTVSAIAIGELHPAAGLEIAIAGDGVVDVYTRSARTQLLYTLRPPQPVLNFGASLAIDTVDAGSGFASLWVGSPTEARVYRFFGDAGTFADEMNAPMGTDFGRSLAVETDGNLLVGAPLYDGVFVQEGAVFRDSPVDWATLGYISGPQQQCDVTAPCRVVSSGAMCFVGTCVGGIVCADLSGAMNCAIANDSGVIDPEDGGSTSSDGGSASSDGGSASSDGGANSSDAGTADSGFGVVDGGSGVIDSGVLFDAGISRDGGSDAGAEVDAGSGNDAGTPQPEPEAPTPNFTIMPCGCGSSPLAPLFLLGLLFARRRVWSKVRARD